MIRGYQLFEVTQDEESINRAKDFITDGLDKASCGPSWARCSSSTRSSRLIGTWNLTDRSGRSS